MSKRSSVTKEKPKKPLIPYFQFGSDRLKDLAGQSGAMKTKTGRPQRRTQERTGQIRATVERVDQAAPRGRQGKQEESTERT